MEPKPNPSDFTFNGVLQQPHYDYAVRAWEKMEGLEWQPIATAPKSGKIIEVSYGDGSDPSDNCLAFWSDNPVCMGGRINGSFPPGWATAGDSTDKNLPIETPSMWREE